jgi:hypothetical protein
MSALPIRKIVNATVSVRSLVLVLMLYFGWIGVLVIVVPVLSYLKTRRLGANRYQGLFLAGTSCLLFSWLILLVEVEASPFR